MLCKYTLYKCLLQHLYFTTFPLLLPLDIRIVFFQTFLNALTKMWRLSIFPKWYYEISIYDSYIEMYSPCVSGAHRNNSNNLIIILHLMVLIAYQQQKYIRTFTFLPIFRQVQARYTHKKRVLYNFLIFSTGYISILAVSFSYL